MARLTFDQIVATLDMLTDTEVVYKVQVDDIKYQLDRAYDRFRDVIGDRFRNAGKWEELTKEEQEIDVPYSLVHLFGKSFTKSLQKAGDTEYTKAIDNMIIRLEEPFNKLKALKDRQVKGRQPKEKKPVIGQREQLRAICPVCFKQHAVDGNGNMVSHGYTLEYGFQNGICNGFNKKHFGTVEGREVTEAIHGALVTRINEANKRLNVIKARGEVAIYAKKLGYKHAVLVENPTERDYRVAEANQINMIHYLNAYQRDINSMLTIWKLVDPIKVMIDITE